WLIATRIKTDTAPNTTIKIRFPLTTNRSGAIPNMAELVATDTLPSEFIVPSDHPNSIACISTRSATPVSKLVNSTRNMAPVTIGWIATRPAAVMPPIITAMIAKQLSRPVKWIEQRTEAYMATTHGRDHIADVEIMGNRDGTLNGISTTVYANLGAYLSTFAPLIPTYYFGLMLVGPYKTPNIYCKTYGIFSNTTPVDAYRGAGRPEATYLVERMLDIFAAEIGMDPVEVRRKNFIPPFDEAYEVATGVSYDSGNYDASMDRALEMVGYEDFRREQADARKEGRYLGIGISSYVEISGAAPSAVAFALGARAGLWESALVRVAPTGKVTTFTGSCTTGQGHETSYAQLVSSELGIPMDDIEIVHGDTDRGQFGIGSFGSRSVAVGGTAIYMSLQKVRDKSKKIAAHLLEAAEEDIVFEDGKLFVQGAPAQAKTFQEVAGAAYYYASLPEDMEPGLEATSFFDPKNFTWPSGTHMAIVEVDSDTGDTKLLRYIGVDDVGTVINPMIVDGMVHGGVAQGVGQALQEEAIYSEDGQLLTGSMADYAIPTASDLPSFELDRIVTPSPTNPMGVKGAGETGTIAASPAVINAVVDALSPLGVRHIDMPAKPEKLWRVIQSAGS
ncbi:MAG: molybdopterin-dependent oxidoreductase, partial [Chloroflexi bacterium]|nr:molybdopterin-dependent oxidoreductase [Chloroflexota bacterium]